MRFRESWRLDKKSPAIIIVKPHSLGLIIDIEFLASRRSLGNVLNVHSVGQNVILFS